MTKPITIGSLFSGIGGFELGLERAGLGPVLWQVEKEEFPRSVLKHHWPEAIRLIDVKEVGVHNLEQVDLICGGFPCQNISPAGDRKGLEGPKSGLWYEFERVVKEVKPRLVVIENNGHRWRAWVPAVRRALWRIGYSSMSFRMLASEVGARHERSRVFVVAHINGEGLRDQYWGRLRENWQSEAQLVRSGSPWVAPNVDSSRELQPKGVEQEQWGWVGDCIGSGWGEERTIEPTLVRNVHGVPDRVASEKALGNAVVPQVSEAIGRAIARTEASYGQ